MMPRDCADVIKQDRCSKSGVYSVKIYNTNKTIQVYCDMDTDGGGWTVLQRRIDGSENFYRNWSNYSLGFGNLSKEFWIGNYNIAALTNAGTAYKLRIDLGDWTGLYRYAEYDSFKIGGATENFKLSVGSFSGDAGNSLNYHQNMSFSTYDEKNDMASFTCATTFRGAWWYNACHTSNLNGEYNNTAVGRGVVWRAWLELYYSLRFSEMKIRPMSF